MPHQDLHPHSAEADRRATTVVLADHSDVFRRGLAKAIAADPRLHLRKECADGAAAVAAIHRHRPDVALLEARLPIFSGLEVCRALAGSGVRLVVMSAVLDDEIAGRILAAGATRAISKDLPRRAILDELVGVAVRC